MRPSRLIMLVPVLCLAQAPGRPRLVVDAAHHDFGKVPPGTKVTHRFLLTNAGDGPLNILKMESSCGCTTTLLGKARVAPGEATELEVTFNSAGLRGVANKSVRVITDDPVAPDRLLTFQAEVLGSVLVADPDVRFEELVAGDRRKATVKLESGTGVPITVTDVTLSEAPWLGVATREEGQNVFVDFELVGRDLPALKRAGTDTVIVHVTNPQPSVVKLRVHWARRSPIQASPGHLAWAEPAGRALMATVRVTQDEHQPFRILAVRTTNPLLKVAAFSRKASDRHRLNVVLAGSAPAGTYDERVILTLDRPDCPELEIRVAATLH